MLTFFKNVQRCNICPNVESLYQCLNLLHIFQKSSLVYKLLCKLETLLECSKRYGIFKIPSYTILLDKFFKQLLI